MTEQQILLYNNYHKETDRHIKFAIAREIIETKIENSIIHYCNISTLDTLSGETWLPLNEGVFSDYFLVSNFGRVKRLFRYVGYRNGTPKRWEEKIMMPIRLRDGRPRLSFYLNTKIKRIFPHQAVMRTFSVNPNGYRSINHIDGDKWNNHILNLEYCSDSYNEHHSFKVLGKKHVAKKLEESPNSKGGIAQLSTSGDVIRTFSCMAEAAKYGFHPQHIGKVIKGERETHSNFKWKFL